MLYVKLRETLRKNNCTQKDLAGRLKICQMAVSNRMTGKTDWRLSEIYAVMDLLQLPREQIDRYFPLKGAGM